MPRPARSLLRHHAHRPWPVPRRPWVLRQSWHDVLFAHWPVDPRALRARIPPELELDVINDVAWVGVVVFETSHGRVRALPPVPGLSRFLEVNVRTYVSAAGRPGVYFFSLDADSALAVTAARWGLRLPYFHAVMDLNRSAGRVRFRSERTRARVRARLDIEYGPSGDPFEPRPRSLEHFLTERYCLFARDHRRRLYRLEIHHPPWPLQVATMVARYNTMVDAVDLATPVQNHPLLHYAARQDMLAWWPTAPRPLSGGAGP